jgi:hypothetical protein
MRRQRWKESGAWDAILIAGHSAIVRMQRHEFRDSPHMLQFFAMSERA